MPKAPAPNRVRAMCDLQKDAQQEPSLNFASMSQKIVQIPIEQIRPYGNHPFQLYTGERLTDMVESIRQNGILMPLIVRRVDGEYELLSGHNRQNAARLARLHEVPCLVKEHLSDDVALMYVIETNLMQRSFSDLLPSEKAAVLSMRYNGMFSQGVMQINRCN